MSADYITYCPRCNEHSLRVYRWMAFRKVSEAHPDGAKNVHYLVSEFSVECGGPYGCGWKWDAPISDVRVPE